MNLHEQFGEIDIYLFDQLLKGRLSPGMSILDAGCGGGRNLVYFLRAGYRVYAVDRSPEAIAQVRRMAAHLRPPPPPPATTPPQENFVVSAVEELPFPDSSFDAVISSAVLHFARDEAQFDRMLHEMWRVLRAGGFFFARLASSIGIERLIRPVEGRRFLLPDKTERFLVDEEMLFSLADKLGARWLDPLKTTNVQNLRCMTTWVLRK
jgi:SAM-dependent methyltransferase